MACCAFAVLLLLNLLAPFAALRRRLFGEPVRRNAAVAWRPGQTAPAAAGGSRLRGPVRVTALLTAQLLVAAAALVYLQPAITAPASQAALPGDWQTLVALHGSWCGGSVPGPTLESSP